MEESVPAAGGAALRAETRHGEYRVGPADLLEIRVYDEDELSKEAVVTHDGFINYPLLGRVSVQGKSAAEIESYMAERLGENYLTEPQVFVSVKEFNSRRAVVLGKVKEPGAYSLTGQTTILDLISRAGGLLDESGKTIVLVRGGNAGASRHELAGASPTEPTVTKRPGGAREPGLQGARLAGALASPSNSVSNGFGETINLERSPLLVDANRLLRLGESALNHVVENDDILFVPESDGVYVYGEVKKPGVVRYREGLTVLQAVSLVEGLTNRASPGGVQVIRSVGGKESKIKVDLDKVTDSKANDVLLKPEDIVVVPESWW